MFFQVSSERKTNKNSKNFKMILLLANPLTVKLARKILSHLSSLLLLCC